MDTTLPAGNGPSSSLKWWILGWYFYLAALQSLLWMTFSSAPDVSRAYLSTDDATLDLLLDLGPIAYCLTVFGAMLLLTERHDGLRVSVILAASLLLFAALLRSVPAILSPSERGGSASMACVYIGQFINAGVAPLIVASPAYLSLLWFPESQRNYVTAIANAASAAGRGVGFFLGPALVDTATNDLSRLLAVEVALAVLPFLAIVFYYPARPAKAPSRAAADEFDRLDALRRGGKGGNHLRQTNRAAGDGADSDAVDDDDDVDDGGVGGGLRGHRHSNSAFLLNSEEGAGKRGGGNSRGGDHGALLPRPHAGDDDGDALIDASKAAPCGGRWGAAIMDAGLDAWRCLLTPSFALVALAGGAQMAVNGAWAGVLPTVLSPRFSDSQAGVFGSVNTFAGIAGGLAFGAASDTRGLRTSLRPLLIGLCVSSALLYGAIALSLKPIELPAFSLSFWPLLLLCGAAGLLRGGVDPLFFEAAAETASPHSAGTAGGILTFFYHIVLVCCLSLQPGVMQWSMTAMAGCLVLSAALLVPVRITYARR